MLLRRFAAAAASATVLGVLPGVPALAEPSDQDIDYLRAVTQMHLAEIEQARVGWYRATDPDIKELAGKLVTSHIRLNAAVGQQARRLRIQMPSEPTPEQQALIRQYESVPAEQFDQLFVTTQLAAHKQTRKLTDRQLRKGDDEDILDVAMLSVRHIKSHQKALEEVAE
ncbi:DUF4142 domain-containing protein [Actinoplanes utahensis]|uniref:DUF4142 domain-containing protein n=1 Tax=Actinoplanes utahensis TaxID=1869 RepID=UPI0013776357|nr:DUF4142 domain-containing protein [Actinoplanes utahensis]